MGITGLLPMLKSIVSLRDLRAYRGQTVGIDGYAWLHRASYTCSQALCLNLPTENFVNWCVRRLSLLISNGVKPIIIFDGARLPSKDITEVKRASSRKTNLAKAVSLLRAAKTTEANKYFQKAVNITPEITQMLIRRLRLDGIDFVVAPYEADAQLAYMFIQGELDAIITEDSDLLVFGCRRVLFKLDNGGCGQEIDLDHLAHVSELRFTNWTHDMFQSMCILSGCDYLTSIPGLGLKRAHALISTCKTGPAAIRRVRFEGRLKVPAGYEELFNRALLTFKHQRVYDRKTHTLTHLHPLPDGFEQDYPDHDFLGPALSQRIAQGIAQGWLHPDTHQPLASPTVPVTTTVLSYPRTLSTDSVAIGTDFVTPVPRSRHASRVASTTTAHAADADAGAGDGDGDGASGIPFDSDGECKTQPESEELIYSIDPGISPSEARRLIEAARSGSRSRSRSRHGSGNKNKGTMSTQKNKIENYLLSASKSVKHGFKAPRRALSAATRRSLTASATNLRSKTRSKLGKSSVGGSASDADAATAATAPRGKRWRTRKRHVVGQDDDFDDISCIDDIIIMPRSTSSAPAPASSSASSSASAIAVSPYTFSKSSSSGSVGSTTTDVIKSGVRKLNMRRVSAGRTMMSAVSTSVAARTHVAASPILSPSPTAANFLSRFAFTSQSERPTRTRSKQSKAVSVLYDSSPGSTPEKTVSSRMPDTPSTLTEESVCSSVEFARRLMDADADRDADGKVDGDGDADASNERESDDTPLICPSTPPCSIRRTKRKALSPLTSNSSNRSSQSRSAHHTHDDDMPSDIPVRKRTRMDDHDVPDGMERGDDKPQATEAIQRLLALRRRTTGHRRRHRRDGAVPSMLSPIPLSPHMTVTTHSTITTLGNFSQTDDHDSHNDHHDDDIDRISREFDATIDAVQHHITPIEM
jgi:exonuclease 1